MGSPLISLVVTPAVSKDAHMSTRRPAMLEKVDVHKTVDDSTRMLDFCIARPVARGDGMGGS